MQEGNLKRTSEVYIDEVKLYSGNGFVADLSILAEEISIFEDIFQNFMSATITLIDGHSILTHAPIIGQELVMISFSTPTFPRVKRLFAVYSVSHRVIDKGSGRQTYKINLISPEALLNHKVKISKAYNETYAETVKKIFTEYLQIDNKHIQSNLKLENTAGGSPVVIPNWTPSDAINFISKKSISKDNPNHAGFLFFQDVDSFHYRSLGSLYNNPIQNHYTFDYKNIRLNNGALDPIKEMRKITSFEILDSPNRMEDMENGVYASRMYTTDIIRKKYDRIDFNQNKFFDYVDHLGNHPNIPTNNETLTQFPQSRTFFCPKHTNLFGNEGENLGDYNKPERWVQQRNYMMRSLLSNRIKIIVPGDSSLRVGNRAYIEFPIIEAPSPNKPWFDEYMTGNYLITSLRHIIAGDSYSTVLECCRDSVSKPYDDYRTINIQ